MGSPRERAERIHEGEFAGRVRRAQPDRPEEAIRQLQLLQVEHQRMERRPEVGIARLGWTTAWLAFLHLIKGAKYFGIL